MRSWPTIAIPEIDGDFPSLQLYSSYAEKLEAVSDVNVSMYVCGITPYDATHLGHAATYLTFDLIYRYLKCAGHNVEFVENITDIDDPLLERAQRDAIDWRSLAEREIELFRSDMTALHICPPQSYIGAVESIPLVIDAITLLSNKNLTYSLDGDIYLSISEVPGSISNLPIPLDEALRIFAERGGDPHRPGKKHPLDTLLWLSKKPDEPGGSSPWGEGRPGWHIECTAIALTYLAGQSLVPKDSRTTAITLQGGGSDLYFPHHYMSGVQVKALQGRDFASLYVHTGMVGLDGEKMSKSKGNLVFVNRLLSEGTDPMVLRIALLMNHYASDRMWSNSVLEEAQIFTRQLTQTLSQVSCTDTQQLIVAIKEALSQNLDTPRIFQLLGQWMSEQKNGNHVTTPGKLSRTLDALLGLAF